MNKFIFRILLVFFLFFGFGNFNDFLGKPNLNLKKENLIDFSPPDTTLKDSIITNDFSSYLRKQNIHPDSIIQKNEKFNLLSDSLKSLYEK